MEVFKREGEDTLPNFTEKEKKKHHYGCFILVFLIVIILAIGSAAFIFRSYIELIPTLLSYTQHTVARTTTEKTLTYKYNGNQKLINILLLGSDNDTKFVSTDVLTQTVIILSINTQTNQVNMISIPRDFWVPIAGVSSYGGYGKIDQASGYGGFALTRETIEKDFGVHIDYYAWVGLGGFIKVIDTFGGVDIDANHPVLDEDYPNDVTGSDPYSAIRLYIPSGAQHLDGTEALEYVRSRHGDLQGDFGRSARQQQILLTLEHKIGASDLITKIPQVVNELQGSVLTDMSVVNITSLVPILINLKPSDIHQYILSPPTYSSDTVTPDNKQDIVEPNYTAIDALFQQLFNSSSN